MEEDGGLKAAPVTRLRRRLSVELEEVKSPSAPSTPTKKRNTRLAAKPQLELIDEHAVTNSPKRTTRKSISRDIAEPEEKPVTPARRNTRSKSNTSLLSEADEKPLTPARRSTRIKSNTSIVSEAAQSVESPRTKRAVARRNSQAGSDTEATLTPARTRRTRKISISSIDTEETPNVSEPAVTPGRTRRTRKGSTSSIDNSAEGAQTEKPSLITEVIAEEPEGKLRKSTSNDKDSDDSPNRKSPRLMAKKSRKSKSEDKNETPKQSQERSEQEDNLPTVEEPKPISKVISNDESDISISSANLIKDLDIKHKNKLFNKNKSMSDVEDKMDAKKRNRTKSWTTICASPLSVEGNFLSDNESTKKKLKKDGKIVNVKRLSSGDDGGSGDRPNQNVSTQQKDGEKKTKKSRNSSISNKSARLESSIIEGTKDVDISNESNKENLLGTLEAPIIKNPIAAELLFQNTPSVDIKSMVFIEDSDSNTGIVGIQNKQNDGEDQCVPVVLDQHDDIQKQEITNQSNIFALKNIDEVANDNSVEPMDIDETMPENVSLTVFTNEGKQSRKSSLCIPQESEGKDTPSKSRRKSSISHIEAKDEDEVSKQARKLSTSVTEEVAIANNPKETPNKSKNKYSLSQSIADESKSSSAENEYVDESKQGKKSRKSSLLTVQETDNSQIENMKKSKRKSFTNSISQDKIDNNDTCNQSNEILAVSENTQSKNVQKLSMSMEQDSDNNSKEINKSKRKSSLSNTISHDKTGNESKSTLVLSQIKDISASENSDYKSPQKSNDLSKLMSIAETNKSGLVNKNLTLNYLTSTPVQQKNAEKLAMQMNTSVITPTNESKKDIEMSKNAQKNNMSTVSRRSANNFSDEDSEQSSEDEVSSKDRSNLIDDQAEDAGDAYESGDSQDEEERQYERENEILEKGETLSSDEEMSNDSDYEKDSFIVSSNEEDVELLSGSGDNLDLSDNELTLSAKSKNKYNERKLKEQKKASREMFEARHGLNEDKDVRSKKNNRNRLDSTLLKSDEDIMPLKKKKRMRLDSTMETSSVKSDSENVNSKIDNSATSDKEEIGYKKKKSKRLSESVFNESVMNEKEISVHNQITTIMDDPLSSANIKTEPKTPQKDFNISRVHIIDDVEQVHVDENVSLLKLNDTKDPLQSTMLQEKNEDSDNDSISENEEITNNYDSMLKELNKENKKKIKSFDTSLNLNEKIKQKPKEAIVDELNLTQTKTSKKDTSLLAKQKSVKRVFKNLADTDESSDAIDLQLIFSDESNGSDKGITHKKNEIKEDDTDIFISLKNTKARTDIRKSINNENANDDGLLNFFVDTKGDLSDEATKDNGGDEPETNVAPLELLYVNEKKTKKSTLVTTPKSEKTKNKLSESQEIYLQESNVSGSKTPASERKKKMGSKDVNEKTPVSEKKKAKKLSESNEVREINSVQEDIDVMSEEIMSQAKKRKRKQSANKSADIDIVESEVPQALNNSQQSGVEVGNKKKKLKISASFDDNQFQTNMPSNEVTEQTSSKKGKKDKSNKQTTVVDSAEQTRVSKKRKERDEDGGGNLSKVFKENSFDKVHVPRLPPTVIDQLEDKPKKEVKEKRKANIVSTSNFIVEETQKRKTKPSDFLEETVYINDADNDTVVKKKMNIKKPKVLPFLPTVSTSDNGFTTNFQVNIISEKMEFRAQNTAVPNFKDDYLNNKKIKKLRTYDLYKRHRNVKLSKY